LFSPFASCRHIQSFAYFHNLILYCLDRKVIIRDYLYMNTDTYVKVKIRERENITGDLSMGEVQLNVSDLVKMKDYYHDIAGLDILNEDDNKVILGKNNEKLLTLFKTGLTKANKGEAGLYHFAIVFEKRSDLAKTIFNIITKAEKTFTGSADHLVSEAFYFTDPEGNSVELYFDKPRSEWKWENGQIKMATLYMDPVAYVKTYSGKNEETNSVKIGHIHLKVGSIEQARRFYVEILGFEITAEIMGALFVSAGGYHHHLGLNIWESSGAQKRDETLGLKNFEIILKDEVDFDSLQVRLSEKNVRFSEIKTGISFCDPWNNLITVSKQ